MSEIMGMTATESIMEIKIAWFNFVAELTKSWGMRRTSEHYKYTAIFLKYELKELRDWLYGGAK